MVKDLQAVIFDLDGVLCSTDEYHYKAWKYIADAIDTPFDKEINNQLRGISRMDSLNIILEKAPRKFNDIEKNLLAEEKNNIYRKLLKKMSKDDLSEEVRTTLNDLRMKGLKLAVGSSSKNASTILKRIGLGDYFDAVSDGYNITHSKPDPEVFLDAAIMLDVDPQNCMVVEDAVAGAEAGHRAGMKVSCVGDASKAGAGDYNLKHFSELEQVI